MKPPFPFSAVVGQDQLKLALLLNAIEPAIGGVLLRGHKGSGKTTLARGLATLLPGAARFVELPLGATEDRLVGTIDLKAALAEGTRRFSPGILKEAHGGVLYVDEVNLLPDHLVDVLLDVAASGVNRVEREGVSEAHESRFVLVGSMNPEEGELRPQLLDRFGLAVEVTASADPDQRAVAVQRRMSFDADPEGFVQEWEGPESALRERLASVGSARRGGLLAGVGDVVRPVSDMCARLGAEGLRADLVVCRAAAALAAWEGRSQAGIEDVRRVAALALSHRRRRSPFEEPGIEQSAIDEAIEQGSEAPLSAGLQPPRSPAGDRERAAPEEGEGRTPDGSDHPGGQAAKHEGCHDPGGPTGQPSRQPFPGGTGGDGRSGGDERSGGNDRAGRDDGVAGVGEPWPVSPLGHGVPGRAATGRRDAGASARGSHELERSARGRVVGDCLPQDTVSSVAVGATAVAAAVRRATERRGAGPALASSGEGAAPSASLVREEDIREPLREQRVANLVVLAVDASGSMGAHARMTAAKTAVVSLLLDAYQRRDRVAMVTFRDDRAEIALRPTGSVEVARARLESLATGGRTPLAAGIMAAARLAEASAADSYRPLIVLVSDGRATYARGGEDPVEASRIAADRVRRLGVRSVVVDAEEGTTRLQLAAPLAEAMGARRVSLSELSGPSLASVVRESLLRH